MYKNSSAFRQRFPHLVSGSNYSEPSSSHSLLSCGQQMNTNTNNTYENQSFLYNPKHFWNYHKVFLGGRSGANSTISSNREVAETPAGKAELFNKYFCFVFLPTTFGLNNSEYATSSSITDMEISKIEVSVDELKEHLSDLDTTKAYGPDKIPARLLKDAATNRPFPHSTSLGTNNSTRARLGWTFSYIYCIFVHPDLDLALLFVGMLSLNRGKIR